MKQDDSPSLYTSSQAVTYEWNSYPLFNKYRCNRITTLKPTPITYFLSVLNKNRSRPTCNRLYSFYKLDPTYTLLLSLNLTFEQEQEQE